MKKKILVTTMALAAALTTAMSGTETLTVHAQAPAGYSPDVDDGCARSENEPGGSGHENAIPIGPEDYSHGSLYEEYDNLGSYSTDSGASYSAPAPKVAGIAAGVTGKEQFRALAKSGSGTYKVTHKGIEIATFTLMHRRPRSERVSSLM